MESKIYKIWSTNGDKIYIGSTNQKYLSSRMNAHLYGYKLWKNNNNNLTSSYLLFDEYGVDSCKIELLEIVKTNNRNETNKIEGKYIKELNAINKHTAGRTNEEYYQINREQLIKKKNEKLQCECGIKYCRSNKARHLLNHKHINYIESINNNILLQ